MGSSTRSDNIRGRIENVEQLQVHGDSGGGIRMYGYGGTHRKSVGWGNWKKWIEELRDRKMPVKINEDIYITAQHCFIGQIHGQHRTDK